MLTFVVAFVLAFAAVTLFLVARRRRAAARFDPARVNPPIDEAAGKRMRDAIGKGIARDNATKLTTTWPKREYR
jgi:hypothetical protein